MGGSQGAITHCNKRPRQKQHPQKRNEAHLCAVFLGRLGNAEAGLGVAAGDLVPLLFIRSPIVSTYFSLYAGLRNGSGKRGMLTSWVANDIALINALQSRM